MEKVLIDGHTVWGHGTTDKQIADAILDSGIVVNPGYGLLEIATPLSSSDRSKNDNAQTILNSVNNWGHKNSKFVVMVEMPNGYRKEQLTESSVDERSGRERTRLPSRFIKGYVDVLNFSFIENPKFEVKAAPTAVPAPAGIRAGKLEQIVPLPTTAHDSADAAEDVW